MADIQTLRKLLAEEFGITSDQELSEALRRTEKVNIGIMTSQMRKEEKQDGDAQNRTATHYILSGIPAQTTHT